jgi:hypothetical protein
MGGNICCALPGVAVVIVAIGLDVDETFARFVSEASRLSIPIKIVNLRSAVEGSWIIELPPQKAAVLCNGDETTHLQPDDAFFCRLIDLSPRLPDFDTVRVWQSFLAALRLWLEHVPGAVVNRGRAGVHNGSKPLHESILRDLGFCLPESITSSNRRDLLDFVRDGPAISKTVCGIRADTIMVSDADFENFQSESGPVHLQRFVAGTDARFHVIGDAVIAQRVSNASVDYRREGGISAMERFEAPAALRDSLIQGSRSLGLRLAGWDFKIDDAGCFWCLEANPMPGYAPYDFRCEGAISRELINYLKSPPTAYDL